MNQNEIGLLIYQLRKENNWTQKQLAERMNISDKTVSKWERGLGYPDISLLSSLSELFDVNINKILKGSLEPNIIDGGNMKRIKFYYCRECNNVITATGNSEIFCCGRKLSPLTAKEVDNIHEFKTETIENDYYLTFSHPMDKKHYISFVCYVSYDKILIAKLYPEQESTVRFPKMYKGKLYFYCTKDGLFCCDC